MFDGGLKVVDAHNSFHDALRAMVDSAPFERKALALFLWPEMKADSAVSKFNGKLNADWNDAKDGHFTFEQVLALMNKTGCFQPLYYSCDDTERAKPEKINVQDLERQRIAAVEAATLALSKAVAAMEKRP